jgi:hypothetical protein
VHCLSDNDSFELQQRVSIAVGCQLAECCPGCSGNTIDWSINVSGEAIESVVLNFENLTPAAARKLTIKGNARWEGNSLRVWKGRTVVSGFKHNPRSQPPVATPRVIANEEVVRRLREAGGRAESADGSLAQGKVVVAQLLGNYVVNEADIDYEIFENPREPPNTDHVDINNNITGDSAVVLLDARHGNGCFNDTDYRGADIVPLGSILSNGGCNSEVAVFSDDNAMFFRSPVNTWTDSQPEKLTTDLAPLLMAEVAVWIAVPVSGTQELAEWHMATSRYAFNTNNSGIGFSATYKDVSANANARQTIGTDCSNLNKILASDFFTAGQLNVYYVNRAFTGLTYCADNPNVIFIGTTAEPETLAHEFGHSFSLDHTNRLPGFCNNNIMRGGGSGRTHFSLGQSFRMNVNGKSALNVNGVRNGVVRDCADLTTSNICPALALDVKPK